MWRYFQKLSLSQQKAAYLATFCCDKADALRIRCPREKTGRRSQPGKNKIADAVNILRRRKGNVENWKIIGRFLAVLNHIVEVFKKLEVSLDILEWLVGEGKEFFEKSVLTPLVAEFRKTERVRVVNETTIMVNLDAPPRLPFEGAVVANIPKGKGWVEVERRTDGLYVDGKNAILHLSDNQKGKLVIVGTEFRKELEKMDVLHPNIMDALCDHLRLIPEDWKKNEDGEILYIHFWDVVFRDSDDNLFVRCFYWDDGSWCRYYGRLGVDWDRLDPAAVRAS
ncbi:MAG: hypothetical protein A3H57_03785 [Candidatus Taylorbacteria bacterium RIFCSPLOWO2_02_FULL_43_11]|nr:MAG: hypothetical protein A2743_01265 [Candidatus Taylorbacteria bacterium RIFCSPHIGHO2_01_FULL_43_47]OHA37511.1 MAG: hypothetical protein A3H57_03785 [Candidatus Taylorbacteria bacterium RIFCSPLOWO2_02_FULL_43_11]